VRMVTGDNYGGEWPVGEFRKHGIAYQLSELNRSQLYLALIPVLNSRRCELPDDRRMIEEFRRLERRRGRSGKDSIDHPAYGGSDDIANSVAGVVNLVIAKPAINPNALPTSVGKGIGYEIRQAGLGCDDRGRFDRSSRLSVGIPTHWNYNGGDDEN